MSRTAVRDAGWVNKFAALVAKDIRIELRGRDTLPPMLAFSLAVAVLLAFTLPATTDAGAPITTPAGTVALADVLAGFFWITGLFAGLIGVSRTF
jgi:ABC-type transport system involved in cytochrome c biogenesis permease component